MLDIRNLLPRRQEIIALLREHPDSSFDFLSRRFPAVNFKTLHYDLNQLQKQGFIYKRGITRGAVYVAVLPAPGA